MLANLYSSRALIIHPENQCFSVLSKCLVFLQTRLRADEAAATGRDDNDADESVLKMEGELDRCLLRLIAAACKGATST